MSTIYELQLANLYPGDEDPTNGQYQVIKEVKLPSLVEKTQNFTPGGGVMSIDIGMRVMEALKLTFKLRGLNPSVMNKLGINTPKRRKYTIRGSVLDLAVGTEIPVLAVCEGKMVKVDIDQFSREGGVDTDYEINEIMHYEFHFNGAEKFYLNFFEGPGGARIDGLPVFADAARNLGLV